MYFQKVLKGIANVPDREAADMVRRSGIRCNWWRQKRHISPAEIKDQLTELNVYNHLNHYSDLLPPGHPYHGISGASTYGDVSPYISTTAGSVMRTASRNIIFPAFMIALQFATDNFRTSGYIFYAYLITLGKKAVPLWQFSEEVRDILIYQKFLPYYQEGEIVAKIYIPSTQIEKAEKYHGPQALIDLKAGRMPTPTYIHNKNFITPDEYCNIRECL